MKKIVHIICMFLIILCFTQTTLAEISAIKIVQAFVLDKILYTYVHIGDTKIDNLSITARIGEESFARVKPLNRVNETSEAVKYLFIVDISSSMLNNKKTIEKIISSCMKQGNSGSSYMLATMGEEFYPLGDFTKQGDEILEKLNTLTFNANKTGLYSDVFDAIDFLELNRNNGIYNIILFSDGIEYDKNGITFDEVKSKVESSEVTIHTIGLPSTSDKNAKEKEQALKEMGVLSRISMGLHIVLDNDNYKSEEDVAKDILRYVNELYVVEFDISKFKSSGREYPIIVSIMSGNKPLVEIEKNVKIPVATSLDNYSKNDSNVSEPSIISSCDGNYIDKSEIKYLSLIIAGIISLIIIVIVFVIIFKRKHKRKYHDVNSTYVRLEVIQGEYGGKSKELYLQDELIIGRDKKCDIVFKDMDISSKNSRVFKKDDVIYIEDLESKNGTAVSNMRIFSANRLRSGDVISIGTIKLMLRF